MISVCLILVCADAHFEFALHSIMDCNASTESDTIFSFFDFPEYDKDLLLEDNLIFGLQLYHADCFEGIHYIPIKRDPHLPFFRKVTRGGRRSWPEFLFEDDIKSDNATAPYLMDKFFSHEQHLLQNGEIWICIPCLTECEEINRYHLCTYTMFVYPVGKGRSGEHNLISLGEYITHACYDLYAGGTCSSVFKQVISKKLGKDLDFVLFTEVTNKTNTRRITDKIYLYEYRHDVSSQFKTESDEYYSDVQADERREHCFIKNRRVYSYMAHSVFKKELCKTISLYGVHIVADLFFFVFNYNLWSVFPTTVDISFKTTRSNVDYYALEVLHLSLSLESLLQTICFDLVLKSILFYSTQWCKKVKIQSIQGFLLIQNSNIFAQKDTNTQCKNNKSYDIRTNFRPKKCPTRTIHEKNLPTIKRLLTQIKEEDTSNPHYTDPKVYVDPKTKGNTNDNGQVNTLGKSQQDHTALAELTRVKTDFNQENVIPVDQSCFTNGRNDKTLVKSLNGNVSETNNECFTLDTILDDSELNMLPRHFRQTCASEDSRRKSYFLEIDRDGILLASADIDVNIAIDNPEESCLSMCPESKEFSFTLKSDYDSIPHSSETNRDIISKSRSSLVHTANELAEKCPSKFSSNNTAFYAKNKSVKLGNNLEMSEPHMDYISEIVSIRRRKCQFADFVPSPRSVTMICYPVQKGNLPSLCTDPNESRPPYSMSETYQTLLYSREASSQDTDQGFLTSMFNKFSLETLQEENYNVEWMRLASFVNFESETVQAIRLAKNGWYSTGNKDQTACFSCHRMHENWRRIDDPCSFHDKECRFLHNVSNNISIPRDVMNNDHSDMPQARHETKLVARDLAATNLSPGNATVFRAEFSEGLSTSRNSSSKPETTIISTNEDTRQSQLEALKKDPMGINFDRPKYPSYAILSVRVSSFSDWPSDKTQTPRDLALAGFFYAGYGDYTRCFFCGGGLRNWEDGDDPWVEHARWFSQCAFVRQNKGQEFIDLVLQRAQELEREQAGNYPGESSDETKSKDEKVMNSEAVLSIKRMGYTEEAIRIAINTLKSRLPKGKHKVSAHDILEIILEIESTTSRIPTSQRKNPAQQEVNPSEETVDEKTTKTTENTSSDCCEKEPRNGAQEKESLRNEILCLICTEKKVSIAFLPCSHLVCCEDCAPAMRTCPFCRKFIKGTVKTFLV